MVQKCLMELLCHPQANMGFVVRLVPACGLGLQPEMQWDFLRFHELMAEVRFKLGAYQPLILDHKRSGEHSNSETGTAGK